MPSASPMCTPLSKTPRPPIPETESTHACLSRVRLLIIRRICISSLTDLIICGILRVYTIDWVSSAMIWVGSAL